MYPKIFTEKVTVLQGVLVEELKANGQYGKPVKYEVSWIYNPIWCTPRLTDSRPLESLKFDIIDFT